MLLSIYLFDSEVPTEQEDRQMPMAKIETWVDDDEVLINVRDVLDALGAKARASEIDKMCEAGLIKTSSIDVGRDAGYRVFARSDNIVGVVMPIMQKKKVADAVAKVMWFVNYAMRSLLSNARAAYNAENSRASKDLGYDGWEYFDKSQFIIDEHGKVEMADDEPDESPPEDGDVSALQ